MKKTYQAPEMISVLLDQNDILTLSGETSGIASVWDFEDLEV
jgi:hypothetical protein